MKIEVNLNGDYLLSNRERAAAWVWLTPDEVKQLVDFYHQRQRDESDRAFREKYLDAMDAAWAEARAKLMPGDKVTIEAGPIEVTR